LAKKTIVAISVMLLITVTSLPNVSHADKAGQARVASYRLSIEQRDGKCAIKYDGRHKGEITFDIPPPCEFVRDYAGNAQRRRYKNKKPSGSGFYDVILVVGGPLDESRSDKLMKDGCGTKVQAMSLSPRGVTLGAVGTDMLVCPSDHLDEKVFGFLAKPN
jgi:hypothetical protein